MSGEHWHSYIEPPDDTRSVVLRFGLDGGMDRIGIYSKEFDSYALSEQSARQHRFAHPTHWKELTEVEPSGH